jgi:hypothetical protein
MQNLESISTETVMFNEIYEMRTCEGIAKSQISQHLVVPAKTGIQSFWIVAENAGHRPVNRPI